MHKYVEGKLPESFDDMFTPIPPPNRTNGLILEKYNSKFLSQFPKYFLPKQWNDNSLFLKLTEKHNKFKKELNKELLKPYMPHVRCYDVMCLDCNPE